MNTFLFVGRVPHGENQTMFVTAISVEKATQKFVKALWAGAGIGERKRIRESEGTDHYLESIHEIEGRVREWYHPQYGLFKGKPGQNPAWVTPE